MIMKTVMIAMFALLVTSLVIGQGRSMQHLIGTWETVGAPEKRGGLQVIDSTRIFLLVGTQRIPVFQWRADFSRTPALVDFTIKDSVRETHVQSLLKFVNNDLIQWQIFHEGTKPVVFAAGQSDMVYLRRKK